MIRTSLLLPAQMHQRLTTLAKQREQSFSQVARELFRVALASTEQERLIDAYETLDALVGVGGRGVSEASDSIDELLYGEEGAWRGEPDDTGLWTLHDQPRG